MCVVFFLMQSFRIASSNLELIFLIRAMLLPPMPILSLLDYVTETVASFSNFLVIKHSYDAVMPALPEKKLHCVSVHLKNVACVIMTSVFF